MREALDAFVRTLRSTGSRLATAAAAVFGRLRWERPAWLRHAGAAIARGWQAARAHPVHASVAALLLVGALGGYLWWINRPVPHYVTLTVIDPELTTYDDKGTRSITPLRVVFSESAAILSQVQKTVSAGISMRPALAGEWSWTSDTELRFAPKDDWPVDGAFTVQLPRRGLFPGRVLLEDYAFTFRSKPFSARITESRFYQDPENPNLKKVVATVSFTHPVETEGFESHVSLDVAKDAEYLGLAPDSRRFTVTYDKFTLAAYVHSAALRVPRDDTAMRVRVEPGVRAARGGNGTPARLEAAVTIPGRASLTFSDLNMTVVDNARYEPEQILLLTSSSPIAERAFAGKLAVKVLPERHPKQPAADRRPYQWVDEERIGDDILALSSAIATTYVPSGDGGNTSHAFRFTAPVGRFVHVVVQADVEGMGGYVSAKPFVATLVVEPYPKALKLLGDGALLPLTGDRRVGFLVRDVGAVQIEIGRVLPNQIQHVAPAMWSFARPSVYADLENRIVERFSEVRDYRGRPPGKPIYESIEVGRYLTDGAQTRRGLFFVSVRETEPRASAAEADEEDMVAYEHDGGNVEDRRFVLVTDLGFLVKQAASGGRDVFVQSLATGLPVAGARVDLVGVNGQPVQTALTDAGGRAELPPPAPALRRERQPLLVMVQREGDLSFVPIAGGSRSLEVSRFDTGGITSERSPQDLSTYLFSDRGIYRPGETAHLGAITRTADWTTSIRGVPIDLEITDPRGILVSRSQIKASAASFDEIAYTSQGSAPTGTYEAVAYLVSDPSRRVQLGSTTFRIQEFEPDRMKVELELSSGPVPGWLTPGQVKARIRVAHLFGEPASGRRADGVLSLTPVLPRFERHPDYRFSAGEVLKDPYQERLAATTTGADGSAEFGLGLERFVGRAYRLSVLGRAYEAEGGRSVAAEASAIVSESPFLVGVKPDGPLTFVRRTSARAARWLAVNQQLQPVEADGLRLEWVQRTFVSVLTRQSDGTMRYQSRRQEVVRDSRSVAIAAGGTAFRLPTDEPGDFELVLRDTAGARLNSLAYSVAGQADLSRSLERNAELQVQLDRAAYAGGDTIQVSIRAPYVGAGLITVERDRVYTHQWFKTTTTSSVQQITLPRDFEGNGYVFVQFVRDPSSTEIFMSPLSYGVAAFAPNLAVRTQAVALTAPRRVRPGAALRMRLVPGDASRAAVLAVDEGILQVARYRNPDPLAYFFQKRRLEVDTSQILDLILPDLKQLIAQAAPGGDAESGFARQLNPFARKRKPAVAYWSGVMDVGPEGRDLSYTVPDYFNGRLRIVAICASAGRMGVKEATTEVQAEFVLTPNVPTTIAPGDEALVTVGVFNATTGAGPIRVDAQPGPGLSLSGPASATLDVAPRREGVAAFRVKANPILGPAAIAFTARRGPSSARIEESIGVRPASPYRTQLTLGRVDGASATVPLARDLYGARRSVQASVSVLPLVWGQGLVAYLDHYEYSCTEQLVSKGVSALMLLSRPEFGAVWKPDANPLGQTYSTLRSRANGSGGIGLWASAAITAEFPSVYAAHFLVEAKEHGQAIPQDVLENLNRWMVRFAATPASSLADGRLRAYAVYLLARQGIRAPSALSNVEQELTSRYQKAWTTDLAAAYLAATYRLLQRRDDAERIIGGVPWSTAGTGGADDIYYNRAVHDAQLLYVLAKHFPARLGSSPPAALEAISAAASGSQASSLSAAYTLLALDAFARSAAAAVTYGIAEVDRDGKARPVTLPANSMPKVSLSEAAAKVTFSQRGASMAYFAIDESGFDRALPSAEVSQGIEVFREFVDAAGATLTRVTVGDEFFVRLRIRSTTRDREPQLAVVDLLPGGVEPVLEVQPPADSSEPGDDPAMARQRGAARALPVGVPEKSDWSPEHADVREDRLILYGQAEKTARSFVYRVRATNAGTFQAPPAFAEGLYNRAVVAFSRGASLEVVPK
jgi:hypothetical protein